MTDLLEAVRSLGYGLDGRTDGWADRHAGETDRHERRFQPAPGDVILLLQGPAHHDGPKRTRRLDAADYPNTRRAALRKRRADALKQHGWVDTCI